MIFIKTNVRLLRMFRTIPITNNQHRILSVPPQKSKSDVYVSICIERQPVITCDKTQIEESIQKTLNDIEYEKSKKSNFELLKEGKLHLLKKSKEEIATKSVVDIEENCQKELKTLIIHPRTSDDETTNNLKSKLQTSLFLITQESNENQKDSWMLPIGIVNNGETLKEAAKRILNESCGEKFNAVLYGNAPVAYSFDKVVDKASEEKDKPVKKIFYFLARYDSGSITSKKNYKWLEIKELSKILSTKLYKNLNHIFITTK